MLEAPWKDPVIIWALAGTGHLMTWHAFITRIVAISATFTRIRTQVASTTLFPINCNIFSYKVSPVVWKCNPSTSPAPLLPQVHTPKPNCFSKSTQHKSISGSWKYGHPSPVDHVERVTLTSVSHSLSHANMHLIRQLAPCRHHCSLL